MPESKRGRSRLRAGAVVVGSEAASRGNCIILARPYDSQCTGVHIYVGDVFNCTHGLYGVVKQRMGFEAQVCVFD